MDETLRIVQNKQIRGHILRILHLSYPQPLATRVIDVCLVDAGLGVSQTALNGQMKYLQDRGYIELKETELKSINQMMSIVSLTSQGIDLLEKTITDPGVMLP